MGSHSVDSTSVDQFVLRKQGARGDDCLRIRLTPEGWVGLDGDGVSARPLRILRREQGGLIVALWGDEVVQGVVQADGEACLVQTGGEDAKVTLKPAAIDAMEQAVEAAAGAAGGVSIQSPIPGLIKSVPVAEGDPVEAGQTVIVLEAMKMENEIEAPQTGTVDTVAVEEGQVVDAGVLLVNIKI